MIIIDESKGGDAATIGQVEPIYEIDGFLFCEK